MPGPDDAGNFRAGASWAWCDECGAQAHADGRPATLVHGKDCSVPDRRVTGRVTAIDAKTGTITYSGGGK